MQYSGYVYQQRRTNAYGGASSPPAGVCNALGQFVKTDLHYSVTRISGDEIKLRASIFLTSRSGIKYLRPAKSEDSHMQQHSLT